MSTQEHWEQIYRTRKPTEVSWYTPHLTDSMRLIREVTSAESSIIDVGGGASMLVDDLLDGGYHRIAVLDIAGEPLSSVRLRLGQRGKDIAWIQADVTSAVLPESRYDLWHDRAVFHFLTEKAARRAYVKTLRRALKAGGHVVMGTFPLSGPEKCSGLDVVRYDPVRLGQEIGPEFELTASEELVHVTPGGTMQAFLLCRFARRNPTNH